jgi:sugar phosphate isomerase/epimerase
MQTSRRIFIKTAALAAAGTALFPDMLLAGVSGKDILGVQLYSVRDDMKIDPAGTLKKLAAMGYKYVEHAGYADRKFYGYSPADFKKLLKDTGLIMDSGHTFLGAQQWDNAKNDFTDEWKHTIEDAKAVGEKFVISPGVDESLCKSMDDFKHYIDMYNKTGELCEKHGLHFAYHNESYEFNHSLNGTRIYDLILQMTNPHLVYQQMDIGNMYEPGGRAMNYLEKYPGRFLLMHVKDEMKRSSPDENGNMYESTILGRGVMPVKEIVDYARAHGGTHYFIIEQESYQGMASLECVKEDLAMMKKWGF